VEEEINGREADGSSFSDKCFGESTDVESEPSCMVKS
jgi:hypothetical protein